MKLYIDKETGKLVNIYAPYKGRSKLDTQEIRDDLGVIEIDPDQKPVDFSPDDYEVTEDWEATQRPYIIYKRKPQEVIARQNSVKAAAQAQEFLNSTDYLFYSDRHAKLLQEEPEREAQLVLDREVARQIIRNHKLMYEVVTNAN